MIGMNCTILCLPISVLIMISQYLSSLFPFAALFALETLPPGVVSTAVGRFQLPSENGFGGFDDSGREVGPGPLRDWGWVACLLA